MNHPHAGCACPRVGNTRAGRAGQGRAEDGKDDKTGAGVRQPWSDKLHGTCGTYLVYVQTFPRVRRMEWATDITAWMYPSRFPGSQGVSSAARRRGQVRHGYMDGQQPRPPPRCRGRFSSVVPP